MPVAVDTTGRIYDDFSRLIFLYTHRETSDLGNELPKESDQFRYLRTTCLDNLKGSVGGSRTRFLTNFFVNFHSDRGLHNVSKIDGSRKHQKTIQNETGSKLSFHDKKSITG
jgi:hypothetical protein